MKNYHFEEAIEIRPSMWGIMANEINKNSIQRIELTIDYIKNKVYSYFNLKPEIAELNKRNWQYVKARKIAMYFSRKYTNKTLKEIGRNIAGKDHTTVMYSIQTVNDNRKLYKEFDKQICDIEKLFIHLR